MSSAAPKPKPKLRVVVPYPNHGAILPRCRASLDALRACTDIDAQIIEARGSAIAYNRAIGVIGDRPPHVKQGGFDFDFVLTVDADIAFTPNDVLALIAWDVDIVSGAYASRAHPDKYVAGRFDEYGAVSCDGFLDSDRAVSAGLVPVDWAGAGFMLIKRAALEAMEYPYYVEGVVKYKNADGIDCAVWEGEDVGFCRGARRAGLGVFCDCGVVVEHLTAPVPDPAAFMRDMQNRLKNLTELKKRTDEEIGQLMDKQIAVNANIALINDLAGAAECAADASAPEGGC